MKKTVKKPLKRTVSKPHVITRVHRRVRRQAKLAVIPHKENGFRPHLVRWYGVLLLFLVIGGLFGANYLKTGSVLGNEAPIVAEDLLVDTNKERANSGLSQLQLNQELSKAAYLKAQDMFRKQYWAHESPDGTTPWAWFARVGYNYAYAGENLAKNFGTADATVAAWMASPTHRANILNSHYQDVGFAIVDGLLDDKKTTLVVAMYGEPMANAAVEGATAIMPKMDIGKVGNMSPMSKFGVAMQTMTPAALSSVVLLMFTAIISLGGVVYRKQIPIGVRREWRYHGDMYKAAGLTVVAVVIVMLYSGGQI